MILENLFFSLRNKVRILSRKEVAGICDDGWKCIALVSYLRLDIYK